MYRSAQWGGAGDGRLSAYRRVFGRDGGGRVASTEMDGGGRGQAGEEESVESLHL